MVSVPQCRFTDLLRSKTFLSLPFLPPLLSISHPKEFSGNRDTLDCPWRIAGQPSAQLLPGTGLGAGPSWGQEGERGKSGVRRGRISWGKVSLCVVLPLPLKQPLEEAWGVRSNVPGQSHGLTSPSLSLRPPAHFLRPPFLFP